MRKGKERSVRRAERTDDKYLSGDLLELMPG